MKESGVAEQYCESRCCLRANKTADEGLLTAYWRKFAITCLAVLLMVELGGASHIGMESDGLERLGEVQAAE